MFRGLPRAFWILCCGALINQLGGFVVPFLAIYLTTVRQVGVEAAGFTVALHGMGSFASSPLGGVLADRIGHRRTMLVALLSAQRRWLTWALRGRRRTSPSRRSSSGSPATCIVPPSRRRSPTWCRALLRIAPRPRVQGRPRTARGAWRMGKTAPRRPPSLRG